MQGEAGLVKREKKTRGSESLYQEGRQFSKKKLGGGGREGRGEGRRGRTQQHGVEEKKREGVKDNLQSLTRKNKKENVEEL